MNAVLKLTFSAGYLVAAFWKPAPAAFLVAFVLSFIGDAMLVGQSKRWLSLGIAAFLSAHIAFLVAFFVRGVNLQAAAIVLGTLTPISGLILRWVLRHASADMHGKVIAYVVVITLMLSAAAGTTLWLGLGAALFYASDIFVARHRFVHAQPLNRIIGLPLYFAAQFLFVLYS